MKYLFCAREDQKKNFHLLKKNTGRKKKLLVNLDFKNSESNRLKPKRQQHLFILQQHQYVKVGWTSDPTTFTVQHKLEQENCTAQIFKWVCGHSERAGKSSLRLPFIQ